MKLKGETIKATNVYTLVIPKADKDYVFKLGPANMSDFEKLCPTPTPPKKNTPKRGTFEDVNDPNFKNEMTAWARKRVDYMMVVGLDYTDDLEFDTVDLSDSSTWGNYQDEMIEAGFTEMEIAKVLNKIAQANGLNNEIIDKATEDFLALQHQQAEQLSSQTTEQNSTQSGDAANASD